MQSQYNEIKELGAEVVGVSVDSTQENQDLAKKAKLSIKLLSDTDGEMMDAYGLRHISGASMDGGDIARPGVFIINGQGQIAWRSMTDNYRVRVRPETVIEQLKAVR